MTMMRDHLWDNFEPAPPAGRFADFDGYISNGHVVVPKPEGGGIPGPKLEPRKEMFFRVTSIHDLKLTHLSVHLESELRVRLQYTRHNYPGSVSFALPDAELEESLRLMVHAGIETSHCGYLRDLHSTLHQMDTNMAAAPPPDGSEDAVLAKLNERQLSRSAETSHFILENSLLGWLRRNMTTRYYPCHILDARIIGNPGKALFSRNPDAPQAQAPAPNDQGADLDQEVLDLYGPGFGHVAQIQHPLRGRGMAKLQGADSFGKHTHTMIVTLGQPSDFNPGKQEENEEEVRA